MEQPLLTEKHHAILFALIAKEAQGRLGDEKGQAVIRLAVRLYGEQRGHRMALRTRRNGEALSMTNFMIYGEWRSLTGEAEQQAIAEPPDVRMFMPRCPWANAWIEADLLPFGRLYCQEIDHALTRGFNPQLTIDVIATQTNEGAPCEFVYHAATLPSGDTLDHIRQSSARLAALTVMPWEYHCAHLYKTCRQTLEQGYGKIGAAIAEAALTDFAARYGEAAAQAIRSYLDIDFDRLPD
jgi:hypothetical protein